jgi:NAD(P)H-flavin reductase
VNEVLTIEDLTPAIKMYEIRVPDVAQEAHAGQFVIIRIRNGADQELMTRRQK